MPSRIDVANLAALKLGADRIMAFEDESKVARALTLVFYHLLWAELARNRWTFAIKRASLPALAAAPSWGFERQFLLPVDCLRLDWIDGAGRSEYLANFIQDSTSAFRIEGRYILTDLGAPLSIRYVARVDNPEEWDPCFVEAFATRLAAEICEDVTQDGTKKRALMDEYLRSMSEAKRISAIQNPPQSIPDDSWVQAREL